MDHFGTEGSVAVIGCQVHNSQEEETEEAKSFTGKYIHMLSSSFTSLSP